MSLAGKLSSILELSLRSSLRRRLDKRRPGGGDGGGERKVRQRVNINLISSFLSFPSNINSFLGGDELDQLVAVLAHNNGPEGED